MKRKSPKHLPDHKTLQECFLYDENTGKLFWRKRPVHHFGDAKACKIFNTLFAGKEAFTCVSSGYKTGRLFGQVYKAHRVIWKLKTGQEPSDPMDHKDRNRSNNRWENLRGASFSENNINTKASWAATKLSGIRRSGCGHWEARIHKNRKYFHLGTFKTKEEAVAIRKQAEVRLYGEFSP